VVAKRAMRARSHKRGEYVWTATSAQPTELAVASFLTFPVVDPIIDLDNPTGQAHCTLMRTRGWLEVGPNEIGNGDVNFAYMIVAYVLDRDIDVTTKPPGTVDTYTHQDILWTAGGCWLAPSTIPVDMIPFKHHEIDIKSKRKLMTGQIYHVVIQNVGSQSLALTGVIRGLVKLP